ncbi:uncharacterized protein ACLA_027820 [Aspergillus clavatus NRRL 1]|uniref:Uncharacterized protein n=1 Tax=Aspergillus clavatus (strain ATCC 1007 / CBS 513.65 / DSM 816 / NCTC 3887 / NRRL 1 / QM 1276 / 107) TaxID=344612 RepID=A1CQY6_ASPCL|nr:uncharacterized protein ACLA_027820 [Aspergillus clavatus NRRL 1]EAW08057.1 conserved hypothetical protein [Aspergillus clavatus NRRL 1]
MDISQRNIRMMHQIGEFLDLDSAKSDMVAEFIALIQAVREGLTQIDDNFQIPDAHVNTLFLTKLKSRPKWRDWATAMLRDPRITAINTSEHITFQELAGLAIKQEEIIHQGYSNAHSAPGTGGAVPAVSSEVSNNPKALTQDDINEFVVKQMSHDGKYVHRNRSVKGHQKRPSQEEINEYVIQQMRREQERKTRNRSQSQPEPHRQNPRARANAVRCTFCGDSHHQSNNCWRRWRVAVEAPQGNFLPKRVEFKSQIPGQPPVYHSGFTLF